MADQWEIDTLTAINETRRELGLLELEWDSSLESKARYYWTNPELCPEVIKTCNCPHWTPPKQIADLLWGDELAQYFTKSAAIIIFNDNITHVALALSSQEYMK